MDILAAKLWDDEFPKARVALLSARSNDSVAVR